MNVKTETHNTIELTTPQYSLLTAKTDDGSWEIKFEGYLRYLESGSNSKDGFLPINLIKSFVTASNYCNWIMTTDVCTITMWEDPCDVYISTIVLVLPNGQHKIAKCQVSLTRNICEGFPARKMIYSIRSTPVVELTVVSFTIHKVKTS